MKLDVLKARTPKRSCGRLIDRWRNDSAVGQAIGLSHRNVCRLREPESSELQ